MVKTLVHSYTVLYSSISARARCLSLTGRVALLEDRVARLDVESALLRGRFLRLRGRRRPHFRRHERMDILWHAARHRLSIERTAQVFVLTPQTIPNGRRRMRRKDPHLLPPLRGLPDLVRDLVHRMKIEWPRWGTRRIAGQLARLGIKASRTSVQRILRHGPTRPAASELVSTSRGRVLLAKRPDHSWMIEFTRVGGVVRPLWIGAVIDAFSRRVLAIGAVRGGYGGSLPSSRFPGRRRATCRTNGTPPGAERKRLGRGKPPCRKV